MPYPNEHAARLKDPDKMDPESFRRKRNGTIFGRVKVPQSVHVIWAKPKGRAAAEDQPLPQALRFPTRNWTAAEAKKWLKDNNVSYISFEPASSAAEARAGSTDLTLVCQSSTIKCVPGDPPRFRMLAYSGKKMLVDGWSHPVVIDLAAIDPLPQQLPVRFAHDNKAGVGHTEDIFIKSGKLYIEGIISRATAAAFDVIESARRGFPWRASIGAKVHSEVFIAAEQQAVVNDRTFSGPIFVVESLSLEEVSFVDAGADDETSVTVLAKKELDMPKQDKKTDKGKPEVEANGTETAKKGAAQEDEAKVLEADRAFQEFCETASEKKTTAAPAPTGPSPEDAKAKNVSLETLRCDLAAESARVSAVRDLCKGHPKIEVKAIKEGWTKERTELEVLRATRPKALAIHSSQQEVSGTILEAACLMSARFPELEKVFDNQTLEAASRQFPRGLGLRELLVEVACANGYTGRGFRDDRAVVEYAFGRRLQAQFSTMDIAGILSAIANKFLLAGFFMVEQTWRRITAIRAVSDFKTITSYRLTGKDQYERVAPGGTIKHGTLGEVSYTNKAEAYALMLVVDRQDIINDDLGAITSVPRKLGRGAGLKINDVFWTVFMNNATFFVAGNNNYQEGVTTALDIDSLTAAEVLFYNLVDYDGKPIGTMPTMILVPPALSAKASQLFKSLELRDTTSDTKYPIANPHAGKFTVEVSRYLQNAAYPGNSDKAWYLLSSPDDLATIETAFLNGQESPTIESSEADFSVLGIQMRGYHDFGVALQEPRGGVKSKGE